MARTAPVPNIPAIPGMNPGVFVMGGGGSGGGGSGKGGSGKGGEQGAEGENGGDGAEGGGKGAGNCGTGGTGGCTNCDSQIARGDPADVVSGEVFTNPSVDLRLPGFFGLELQRSYSTREINRDCGLGWGWAHSLAWDLEVGRRDIVVRNGAGHVARFPMLREPGEQASLGTWGLVRTSDGFMLRPGDEFLHFFEPVDGDPRRHRLVAVSFRNRGVISLHYDRGRLVQIVDTAGRNVRLGHNQEGRIRSIVVGAPGGQSVEFARYEYDPAGHLTGATDADGFATHYRYDDEHRLSEIRYGTGLTFHFVYDSAGRCIETWGDYPGGTDPALAPDLPAELADGRTAAKGIYHCRLAFDEEGFSECADSVRLQRFEAHATGEVGKAVDGRGGVTTRSFDENELVSSHTDMLGATTHYAHDDLGMLIKETDAEGRTVTMTRDSEGRILEMIDPAGGVVSCGRDQHGDIEWLQDQRGGLARYQYDDRGQLVVMTDTRGGRTALAYDSHGNIAERTLPNGLTTRFEHDHWGRLLKEVDPSGREWRFGYSAAGQLLSVTDPLGRTQSRQYDGLGEVVAVTTPDGHTTRFEYGGFRWHCRTVLPDGQELKWRFNREGWIVAVENERGEQHSFEHDPNGMVVAETTFDGRTKRYGYDAMNRISWTDDGTGKTELDRNLVGQVVEKIAPDGSVVSFEYDARGELVAARGAAVDFEWGRDPVGDIVREAQTAYGVRHEIESERDAAGARTGLRTSLGHELDLRRDLMGKVSELADQGGPAIRFERDPWGSVTRRDLAGGGSVEDRLDPIGRLEQRVVHTSRSTAVGGGQPGWVGDAPGRVVDKTYHYTPIGELARTRRLPDGSVDYEYDVRRHLKSSSSEDGSAERFATDTASNYYEAGPEAPDREYGPGNRLLKRGATEYVYDDQGRQIEKRVAAGDEIQRWRYQWDPWGMLAAVELPDQDRVEFVYDAFARRMGKRRLRPRGDGSHAVVSTTHYVWDLLSLVHEQSDQGTRTFLYEENDDVVPLAHRDGDAGWVHYVGDINGTPEELVGPDGGVLGRLQREAFGRVPPSTNGDRSTPIRFPGQYADDETGLHYNRYRYYDPDTGRYLSPDPIGLEGGTNLYAYGPNPIGWFDPMGWTHLMEVESVKLKGGGDGNVNDSYQSGMGPDCPAELKSRAKCHTERKVIHDLNQISPNPPGALKGAKIKLKGKLPPCPNCHRAMEAFAKEQGVGNMQYKWTDSEGKPQSVTYSGKPGTPPKGSKGGGKALTDAYSMSPDAKRPNGYKFDNWKGAQSAYKTAKGP